MRRLCAVTIAFVWLCAQPFPACARDAYERPQYQPPEAVSITDVTASLRSIATGTVVLDVLISESGSVANIEVRRDLPSVTEDVVRTVKAWKFAPGRFKGKPVSSRITVAATFNPQCLFAVPLPPLIHQGDQSRIQASFQPAEVTSAAIPPCTFGATIPAASVVLQATIDEAGKVKDTRALHDIPPFTAAAIRALQDWRFVPATLDGKPIESKVVLAFFFWPPASIGGA
jgi:TonB family protein